MRTTGADERQPSSDGVAGPTKRRRRWSLLAVVSLSVVGLTILAAVVAPLISAHGPLDAVPTDRLLRPGADNHLLGTDQIGRDILARVIFSARTAWAVAASVSLLSVLVGGTVGLMSGYRGGRFDLIVSRFVDGVLAFPPVLLALVLAAAFGAGTVTAIIALAIVYVPMIARIVRSSTISEKGREYVLAARGLGYREFTIVVRHVLPNIAAPILVVGTVVASRAMILESSLSFLGVGTQPPTPSWGSMITEGRQALLSSPHIVLIPAIALSLTVLSVNLFADALGDRLDPRDRPSTRALSVAATAPG